LRVDGIRVHTARSRNRRSRRRWTQMKICEMSLGCGQSNGSTNKENYYTRKRGQEIIAANALQPSRIRRRSRMRAKPGGGFSATIPTSIVNRPSSGKVQSPPTCSLGAERSGLRTWWSLILIAPSRL
jgi:hypothetical protein